MNAGDIREGTAIEVADADLKECRNYCTVSKSSGVFFITGVTNKINITGKQGVRKFGDSMQGLSL